MRCTCQHQITGLNYLKTKGSVFIYNSTVTIICSVFRCIISIVNFPNKNLENVFISVVVLVILCKHGKCWDSEKIPFLTKMH